VLRGRTSKSTSIREVMTAEVCSVDPDDTVETCMTLMTERRMRHLLVLEGSSILGLLSIGDCVAHLCDELVAENGYLREYIMGKYPG
jgi:signal-transduction protein with cAMP-binding, CBS, and nucleotidyltransferase domain